MVDFAVKTIPQSEEIERTILGCMLSNQEHFRIAMESLSVSDFSSDIHQKIFRSLKDQFDAKRSVDIVIISEDLREKGQLEAVGGLKYLVKLAQSVGKSAYIEEYIEILKDRVLKRRLISIGQELIHDSLSDDNEPELTAEKALNYLQGLQIYSSRLPTVNMKSRLENHDKSLEQIRGKSYIGLLQKTIPSLDDCLLGLRKLIILPAAPNIGKTALATQLGLDVVRHQKNACLVFFSLEMTAEEIFTRMRCHLANMDYRNFVLGSLKEPDITQAYFTDAEHVRIEAANKTLCDLEYRIQIIDSSMSPSLNARTAIGYINELKTKTGCDRVIVIVDYLQVWPITGKLSIQTELELDRWRVSQIKQIRDAINNDPIIVISEARKPSGSDKWGGDMSDIMGSARAAYTPDVVMLYYPTDPLEIARQWEEHRLPIPKNIKSTRKEDEERAKAQKIREYLGQQGIGFYTLKIEKGRDGMHKGEINLMFHFRKNIFKPLDWLSLKMDEAQQKLKNDATW
jgi:replicative DNA helicase